MPGGLSGEVGIESRREGSVGPTPGLRKAGQKLGSPHPPPPIIFYSVVWSALETAGLSAPCVAVVSGKDVVQGGIFFFSLNLKGFLLERGTDCTFST